jgi:hypothetical protein
MLTTKHRSHFNSRLQVIASGLPMLLPLLVIVFFIALAPIAAQTKIALPSILSDREFWSLIDKISEADGFFRSNSGSMDNLLSNESQLSAVAEELTRRVKPSGVYLGVGPEQNFTYIAATKPRIAFITDIRRGNLELHLV